ncbi:MULTISPECIES: helix-turn-helix domain-containing protein [Streptomyces]|uniref:helix-turn-helix domain-containing protein n=1 Tax=Streptomyces TaxID=1883 RepID=UPI00037ADEC5
MGGTVVRGRWWGETACGRGGVAVCHSGAVYREQEVWSTEAASGLVLPDGCLDLIWSERVGLLVAGPDTRGRRVDPGVASGRATGLRFAPGRGPVVVGVPAWELRDRLVPLAQVWPQRTVRELAERVAGAGDPGAVLAGAAARRVAAVGPPEPWRAWAASALGWGFPVAEVARRLGLSERQLRRRCQVAFGYGPKTLARVLRMRRALGWARAGVPGAEVAVRAGYADQAHLSREVRGLAGVPLSALVAVRGPVS